ncbi:MAG: ectonucleotide pyrophosphatase/phosphodiesterase [Clostridium tyrobutyricum]|uniref:alkaline phosphatase family protein n=1 Tax=Clostridium tyrobutyricum TaxID=1519 RepID=UPI0018AB0BE7|nr:ectonucleotide pyrophosphatase/phosphodiesterase [Clostridium tyrobutyricum]MBV4439605.1 alkaline phosphatase family protein [Clostridium tyrobutyricum]MCH4200505.1 ectonucleotide pyrophosphatase/phosphodiesterase [Clostridium tyrobutyricum]MCH4236722.1 ectonucleotide pyrophosphatase/phosphodiesterase [Clostridium tyrobutyricum]MCH4259258.1 ectonucleotide pyrophosphatase/phosphodiesterase [Clostridium tyrobutyricum]MCI1239972.1 ectonucleotide pyrophosphatase/phosphodiesterase [Clostridium t
MSRMTKYLYVISFDGLSSLDFEYISSLPNFKRFLAEASYCKNVYSVYPSLTYPAHTTIVTGKYPRNHGIVNNTLLQPYRESPDWYWSRKYIKGDTIYDLAIKKGMKVAAFLWPVTANSKIQYNVPEIFPNRFWQNQLIVSFLNGSPLFQYEINKKFGYIRNGISHPELDDFIHRSFLYTIETKRPDITFVHYSELDAMRHCHGFYSTQAKSSLKRHDKRLGEIIETLKENHMYEDSTIIALGDHSSFDEDKIIDLNVMLKNTGYIHTDKKGNIKRYRAFVKNCDGCAYVYLKDSTDKELKNRIYSLISNFNRNTNCIEKIYNSDIATKFGADPKCTFMLEAKRGFYFLDGTEGDVIKKVIPEQVNRMRNITKATHGYSPYKKDYTTVFMAGGKGIRKNAIVDKMNLIDEAPTMAKLLGIKLKNVDGRVIDEFMLE